MKIVSKEKAIKELQNSINQIDILKNEQGREYSPKFKKWERNTEIAISKIFKDKDEQHKMEFSSIGYCSGYYGEDKLKYFILQIEAYKKGLEEARSLLESMIEEIEKYWEEGIELEDINNENYYVSIDRIEEMKSITNSDFDLCKLIRLCEEINICYKNNCFFTTGMLVRAITDHVPPIFQKSNFNEVANNYGAMSFKGSMKNLNNSLRKIADSFLHIQIRNKESLPNKLQINFSQDLDVLLSEIYRILK